MYVLNVEEIENFLFTYIKMNIKQIFKNYKGSKKILGFVFKQKRSSTIGTISVPNIYIYILYQWREVHGCDAYS